MANSAKTDSAPSRNKKKGTVFPVDLQIDRYRTLEGFDFVDALFADLERLKDQRFEYYCDRFKKSPANRLRSNLVLFAILATVLTAIAAGLRILVPEDRYDVYFFAAGLLTYGVMTAILLYDKTADVTARYFRSLGIAMAIRDLWTKLEFEFLKESLNIKPGDKAGEIAVRDNLISISEAFCADLDSIVRDELNEFQTEFKASISKLDAIARQGQETGNGELRAARQAYDAAAQESRDLLAEAEAASKPVLLNIDIKGEFDDMVTLNIDNVERMKTDKKKFALDQVVPGHAKIEAFAVRDGHAVSFGEWVELRPGIHQLEIELC